MGEILKISGKNIFKKIITSHLSEIFTECKQLEGMKTLYTTLACKVRNFVQKFATNSFFKVAIKIECNTQCNI